MTDDWLREMETQKIIGTILLDFRAAFDILDHSLLLEKLSCYAFEDSANKWIKSYLTNRKYSVYFNGSYSEIEEVQYGVPQGSCLGPLLFSIFINDLPLVLKSATIVMYADDVTVYDSASTAEELNEVLNKELRLIKEWVTENRLALNIEKTKSMVLGSKYWLKSAPILNLSIGNKHIEQKTEVKLFGLIIDDKMSWNSYINQIVIKMGRGMAV